VQKALEIPEPRSGDVRVISEEKVLYAFGRLRKPVVVLDAGFYIHSLNGFPSAYVNFALQTIGLQGILTLVEGKDRACEFRECLAYLDADLEAPVCFGSSATGFLAHEPRGEMREHLWSELGRIFVPDGSTRTLAEFTYIEYFEWLRTSQGKTSASHLLAEWLRDR